MQVKGVFVDSESMKGPVEVSFEHLDKFKVTVQDAGSMGLKPLAVIG
jgi:hypothetical protein